MSSKLNCALCIALLKLVLAVPMCTGSTITLNNANGTITSPNYPDNYQPKDSASYVINAPLGHVISMGFYFFETANNGMLSNSDYLSINDGMSYQSFLFGAFENPFYITSRTNQLMLEFITNSNNSTSPGFELDYEIIQLNSTCNSITEKSDDGTDDFVQCEETAFANDNNIGCMRGCGEGLIIQKSSRQSCFKNAIYPFVCINASLLKECEDSAFVNCPYTVDEVSGFYRSYRVQSDGVVEIQYSTTGVNPNRNGGSGTSQGRLRCPNKLCRQNKNTKMYNNPLNCSTEDTPGKRLRCLSCRFEDGCKKAPGKG